MKKEWEGERTRMMMMADEKVSAELRVVVGIDIGIRNLSLCELVQCPGSGVLEIRRWELVDMLEGTQWESARTVTAGAIHAMMEFQLSRLFPDKYCRSHVHHVCIEAQPLGKFTNNRTQLVSHLIYEHFRRHLRDVRVGETLQSVTFTQPGRKYSDAWLGRYGLKKGKKHADRKLLSVQLCTGLLRDEGVQNATSVTHVGARKADDLADAFLLALDLHLEARKAGL